MFTLNRAVENFGLAVLRADAGLWQPEALTDRGSRRQGHNAVMKAETITLFPICNISSIKLCVKRMDRTVNSDSMRDNSAGFSRLDLRSSCAVLDEMSSPAMPQMRKRKLPADVGRRNC